MKTRVALWGGIGLMIVAVAAVVLPASPFHINALLGADGRAYDGQSVGHWKHELASPNKEARQQAFTALGSIGASAGDAVPDVARAMVEDPDDDIRVCASLAMVKLAPNTKSAVPQLIQALSDRQLQVRHNALTALGRLKADARPAVPALIAVMKNPDNDSTNNQFTYTVQEGAVSMLGVVTAGTPDAVQELVDVLTKDDRLHMKVAAARALGAIGDPARAAVPALYELNKRKERHVREEANIALRALGEKIEPFKLSAEEVEQDAKMRSGGMAPKKDGKGKGKEKKDKGGEVQKAPKAGPADGSK